jgi:hypothetical protein
MELEELFAFIMELEGLLAFIMELKEIIHVDVFNALKY